MNCSMRLAWSHLLECRHLSCKFPTQLFRVSKWRACPFQFMQGHIADSISVLKSVIQWALQMEAINERSSHKERGTFIACNSCLRQASYLEKFFHRENNLELCRLIDLLTQISVFQSFEYARFQSSNFKICKFEMVLWAYFAFGLCDLAAFVIGAHVACAFCWSQSCWFLHHRFHFFLWKTWISSHQRLIKSLASFLQIPLLDVFLESRGRSQHQRRVAYITAISLDNVMMSIEES